MEENERTFQYVCVCALVRAIRFFEFTLIRFNGRCDSLTGEGGTVMEIRVI